MINSQRSDVEKINLIEEGKKKYYSNGKTIILSKCAACGSKKSRSIKKQEVKRLLSN